MNCPDCITVEDITPVAADQHTKRQECPFCAGTRRNLDTTIIDGQQLMFVVCNSCGATGPKQKHTMDALTRWETRREEAVIQRM